MNQKQLFRFAGKCLALDDNPEHRDSILSRFTNGDTSPEDFIRFCDRHLVLPAIYLRFKNHNLLSLLPPELKAHIAGIYLRNRQRNLEILQQADEINRILEKQDIQPVYLKGTAHLMDKLYADPGERLIGDIDVLVQENDYLNVVHLLEKQGYATRGNVYSDVMKSTHYPPLFKAGAPVHLEIHRIPVNPPASKWFDTGKNFQQKKKITDMPNCFVQSGEHQVIHNFIHSRLNNLGHGFYVASLRDLYDFYLLSKRAGVSEVRKVSKQLKKLNCCYAVTDWVFGSQFAPSESGKKYTKQYIKRFEWYMMHPGWHHRRIFAVKLNELVFRRFIPSLGALFTFQFWARTFRNLTKAGFYRMLADGRRYFTTLIEPPVKTGGYL